MSKAFTKETDESDFDDDLNDETPAIPGGKNYITPEGARKLRNEMKHLLDVERAAVVKVVSWAASNGDRSENADYIYGKRRLREIDKRVRFLSKRLEKAEIVDPKEIKSDRVLFGATVVVLNENKEKIKYQIVGVDEIDIAKRRVSWLSPIGKALMQANVGDQVILKTPKGEEELEILSVTYEEII